ncbi:hypothetical protein Adt_11947 [Abeliophyllum distichum]|uniref:Uncharacterized protein n=1 Tax=Abeliophyllum distichum TaxID=126358 RepID=A0ABD1UR15_9LAMI
MEGLWMKRRPFPPRLLIVRMVSILAFSAPLVAEVARSVYSFFPSLSTSSVTVTIFSSSHRSSWRCFIFFSITKSVLVAIVPPIAKVAWSVSSSLLSLGAASVLTAIISLTVGIVGNDPTILLLETSTSSSINVLHQDKEKGFAIDEWEKMVPKRTLEIEGADIDSGRVQSVEWLLLKKLQNQSQLFSVWCRTLLLIRLTGLNVSILGLSR